MSFLQPALLWGLLAIALPVLVHLLNRFRHRTVEWGAMYFLREAARRTRGRSRLRHLLILAARMSALAALFLAVSRPLSGGFLGAWSSAVDTVVVVLDRSPSTARVDPLTGREWRAQSLGRIAEALRTTGAPKELVLVESGLAHAEVLPSIDALLADPDAGSTDAPADLPALLDVVAEHLESNESGRTEVWVVSDSQRSDWHPESERWVGLRRRFTELEAGVRFHVFTGPEPEEDLSVRVTRVRHVLQESGAALELDLEVHRSGGDGSARHFPLGVVVDGARSVLDVTLEGDDLRIENHRVPLDAGQVAGFGWVDLPHDAEPRNDVHYFAYGEESAQRCLLVLDDRRLERSTALALAPPHEFERTTVETAGPADLSRLELSQYSCVVWQGALPEGPQASAIEHYLDEGGAVLFLPPAVEEDGAAFLGVRWGAWRTPQDAPFKLPQWRDDDGLLAHAQSGAPLPVAELEVKRACSMELPEEAVVLAHTSDGEPFLARASSERGVAHFLATLPLEPDSNLALEGVVWFVVLQRLRELGGARLSLASAVDAGTRTRDLESGVRLAGADEGAFAARRWLISGVDRLGDRWIARNRPRSEDVERALASEELVPLFDGLDLHLVAEGAEGGSALVEEIWKLFLGGGILFLLLEALLCLPARPKARPPLAAPAGARP